MCLAIPAEVVELQENETALVEIGGVRKVVSLMLLDGVKVGDYVLVHAGFAMEKVDREEAERTLAILEEAAEYGPLYE
ncbi:HypC/HybG/HupF family hydrogenase formation chaperone [Candidatus Solincola sp.]|jgi:hydrogenase expression/formation protein HypC|nr:HypC/HybG/HupF family hydrogenase formation chaperone [Actinomycetota bacterium]MDI7252002.1 HypC/HybG/HupF family hydrogenase formation chaperone [Actinomycetota bacterium]